MASEEIIRSEGRKNYLNAATTVKSWLLTLDHKRIGLLYLFAIFAAYLADKVIVRALAMPGV